MPINTLKLYITQSVILVEHTVLLSVALFLATVIHPVTLFSDTLDNISCDYNKTLHLQVKIFKQTVIVI